MHERNCEWFSRFDYWICVILKFSAVADGIVTYDTEIFRVKHFEAFVVDFEKIRVKWLAVVVVEESKCIRTAVDVGAFRDKSVGVLREHYGSVSQYVGRAHVGYRLDKGERCGWTRVYQDDVKLDCLLFGAYCSSDLDAVIARLVLLLVNRSEG